MGKIFDKIAQGFQGGTAVKEDSIILKALEKGSTLETPPSPSLFGTDIGGFGGATTPQKTEPTAITKVETSIFGKIAQGFETVKGGVEKVQSFTKPLFEELLTPLGEAKRESQVIFDDLSKQGLGEEEIKAEIIKSTNEIFIETGFALPPSFDVQIESGQVNLEQTSPTIDVFGAVGALGQIGRRLTRGAIKKIAGTKSFSTIFSVLKESFSDVSESLLRQMGKRLQDVVDPKLVRKVAQEFEPKLLREIGQRGVRAATPSKVAPELESLAQEARKTVNELDNLKINPSKLNQDITSEVNKVLEKKGLDARVVDVGIEGSLAEGRFVRGKSDIDINIATDKRIKPEQLSDILNESEKVLISKYGKVGNRPLVNLISLSEGKTTAELPLKQLTDFFNKAKGVEAVSPRVKTSQVKPQTTPDVPVAQPATVPISEAVSVSNANRIDPQLGAVIRKNPSQTPDYIAMRTMEDGRQVAAIRAESGIFAPKDFETFEFKDIKGLITGKKNVSTNFRDAALSFDNIPKGQLAERGGFGPMFQTWYKGEESIASKMTYVGNKTAAVQRLAQKYEVKITKQTGDQIFNAWEGKTKGIPDNIVKIAKDLRDEVLNIARADANRIRKPMGKKDIGFLNNYAPHIQQVNFWRDFITDGRTTITDNFDFIIPNAKKNPHAIPRIGGMGDLNTNAWELTESYLDSIANDIYVSPQIEQLKAIGSVLKGREQFGMSGFLDTYIRNNLTGKPGQFDSALGLTEGSKGRAILNRVNMARNISALAGNLVWITFVQPASLVLTAARGGGITRGPQNMVKGFWKFAFGGARNARVRKLPTLVIKTEGASVGMTGAGDIDRLGGKIFKSKLESYNDFVGKLADWNEYWLTGGSMSAGYEEASKLGLKGRDADMFANWLGGATQSQYNREARTVYQNSLIARTLSPFSTYAFEVWRFAKTLIGKQGGMPLEKSERLNQAIAFMAGAYLYNQYSEKITGRKLFTVGSGVPVVGGLVDTGIDKGKVILGLQPAGTGGGGRSPIAPEEDVKKLRDAFGNYVNDGNFRPLRKELIKWGMGFGGIAGASTLNRFIDGMQSSLQGYMTTRKGEPAFIIEGADKVIAPLLGPYSTEAGKKYLNKVEERDNEENRVRPTYEEVQSLLEEGLDEEAQEIVNALSADEWKVYQRLGSREKAEVKAEGVMSMIPTAQEGLDLLDKGKDAEAQELVNSLTDQEWEWYQGAIKQVEKLQKAKDGIKPSFLDGDIIDDRSLVEIVFTYAKAIGIAPIDAAKAIFAGERIKRVDNRTVIVFRLPFTESQSIRSEWADGASLDDLRLDHTIPLQLGGFNDENNLQLISAAIHSAYTPIENHIGKLLRDNKIEKKEARQLILDFKEGRITASDILKL